MCPASAAACPKPCGSTCRSILCWSSEKMNTQFGLANLWSQGDIVTRGVALLLLAMSLSTWIVIVVKALDLRKFAVQARATESFWHASDFADGLSKLGTDPGNPFRELA